MRDDVLDSDGNAIRIGSRVDGIGYFGHTQLGRVISPVHSGVVSTIQWDFTGTGIFNTLEASRMRVVPDDAVMSATEREVAENHWADVKLKLRHFRLTREINQ